MADPKRSSRTRWLLALLIAVVQLAVLPSAAEATWTNRTKAPGIGSGISAGISCPDAMNCLAIRNTGKAQRSTDGGVTWVDAAAEVDGTTYSVDCPTVSACYATDTGGAVWKSTNMGNSWTLTRDGTPALYGIDCPDADTCYAVGSGGTIRKTTNGGSSWTLQASTGSGVLYSVSCPSITHCMATEAAGEAFRTTNGSTWDEVRSSSAPDQISPYTKGLSCPTTTVCYTGGTAGTISKTTNFGSTWTEQTSGSYPDIYAMACASATRCMAVGANDDAIFTDDGGATAWQELKHDGKVAYTIDWAGTSTAVAISSTAVPFTYAAADPLPPATGNVTVSGQLTAGTRAFADGTPSDVTFPKVSLDGTQKTVTTSPAIVVNDATGSGSGWAINVETSTFTAPGGKTLPSNSVSVLAAPSVSCKSGVTCTTASNNVGFPKTFTSGASEKLFNAQANSGLGAQTITPTWRLTIPATALSGVYTSTWTITLTVGP